MIRRSFLKLVSSAAFVALVTTEGFRPVAGGGPVRPEPVIEVQRGVSEVLQALDDWNDKRWREHGGILHEDGSKLIWNADRHEFNKISAPTRRLVGRATRRSILDSFLR